MSLQVNQQPGYESDDILVRDEAALMERDYDIIDVKPGLSSLQVGHSSHTQTSTNLADQKPQLVTILHTVSMGFESRQGMILTMFFLTAMLSVNLRSLLKGMCNQRG